MVQGKQRQYKPRMPVKTGRGEPDRTGLARAIIPAPYSDAGRRVRRYRFDRYGIGKTGSVYTGF